MDGGVYTGRIRRPGLVVLWALLSLGVYTRVLLYRSVREIDGHDARFLSLRLYLLGVILPFGGPLAVKWRLAELAAETVQHDVTARPVHVRRMRALAFVPWFPAFALSLIRHLNPHWALHRKIQDLEGRREMLEQRRRVARSKEALEEVARLDAELRERVGDLEDARQAALAIRDANLARRRAEIEIAAIEGPRRKIRLFPWRKSSSSKASLDEPSLDETVPAPTRARGRPWRRKRAPAEPEGVGSEEGVLPVGEPIPGPAEADPAEAGTRRGLFGLGRKGQPPEAPPTPEPGPEALPEMEPEPAPESLPESSARKATSGKKRRRSKA